MPHAAAAPMDMKMASLGHSRGRHLIESMRRSAIDLPKPIPMPRATEPSKPAPRPGWVAGGRA
eukprot:CAMPEP_0169106236 /NCGR_PEP_ID=MMETSP1015-20121227/24228_1 /TAXON_ID=342587 /ORGANISM="Karlodinium micrum, Strain CCMP2283" /LENGTH=62 /DNA_ID=CAMNT_0009167661 /DNA_START=404 /DNA_END=592 /DNA_ORIENTATION=-